jgi:hypothetical protein
MPDSQGPFDDAANHPSVGERPYETRRGSRSPDESLLSESVEVALPDDSFRRLDSFGPVDSRLVEVKEAIENSLGEQVAARQNQRRSAAFFEGIGIIQGVGVGYAGATGGELVPPGESVLTVFVADDISPERVRALLVDSLGVRAEAVEELPINVVVTGAIESMAQTSTGCGLHPVDCRCRSRTTRRAPGPSAASPTGAPRRATRGRSCSAAITSWRTRTTAQ